MTSSSTPVESAARSTGRLRWICLLLALVTASCGSWLALQQIDQPLTGIDDANIFFTYASNLAGGEGFVYNAGGERVEGFTSLLWTLICACAFLVSSQPEPLLLAISTVLLATALYQASCFLAESITKPGNETRTDWLTLTMLLALAAWVLATPRFMVWTTVTLMDTGLWCMVFTCGTIAFARAARQQDSSWQNDRCLVGWTVAMLLTRPEAMLIVLVWISSLAIVRLSSKGEATGNLFSRLWSHCRLPLLGYLVTLGMLTLFRLVYFGYPLPNTYYAKVSPSLLYNLKLGGGYFLAFVGSQLFIVLALVIVARSGLLALHRTLRRRSHDDPGQVVLAVALVCALGIPVITGGDHFNLFRFFQPCWLLLALPLLIATGRRIEQSRLLRANALLVVATLAGSAVLFYSIQYPRWNELGDDIQVEFKIAAKGRQRGELLNQMFAGEDISIGVGTAGGVGLTYRGEVIDLLGLNNLAMGHSPGDRKGGKNHAAFNQDVFFEQLPDIVRPTLIQPHQPVPQDLAQFLPDAGGFWDTALDGMERSSDRFHQLYRPIVIECPGESLHLRAWCRPHVVDLLREKGASYRDLSSKPPF
tara:strand:+ start:1321 stop:3090 length:1770 start_codon:yes stop_codon:yes gene_type:complete